MLDQIRSFFKPSCTGRACRTIWLSVRDWWSGSTTVFTTRLPWSAHRLVLVKPPWSAPGLSVWEGVESAAEASFLAAWLSLDENDSDLNLFLRYFIAALRTIFTDACAETLALLQAQAATPAGGALRHTQQRARAASRRTLFSSWMTTTPSAAWRCTICSVSWRVTGQNHCTWC